MRLRAGCERRPNVRERAPWHPPGRRGGYPYAAAQLDQHVGGAGVGVCVWGGGGYGASLPARHRYVEGDNDGPLPSHRRYSLAVGMASGEQVRGGRCGGGGGGGGPERPAVPRRWCSRRAPARAARRGSSGGGPRRLFLLAAATAATAAAATAAAATAAAAALSRLTTLGCDRTYAQSSAAAGATCPSVR